MRIQFLAEGGDVDTEGFRNCSPDDLDGSSGEAQKQLSKEFVRKWLIENGFQGKSGQKIPNLDNQFIHSVSERYIELFNNITNEKFAKADNTNILSRVEENVSKYLSKIS